MIKQSMMIAIATASFLGSNAIALAQTPAGGAGAGVGADAAKAERIEQSRMNREPGMTTGSDAMQRREMDRRDVNPIGPSGAPVPNAAISQPSAVEAAPAGR